MSKPSTTPTPKVSTRPPRKPASAKRHPQAETSISTSSKSSQSLTSPYKNATNQPAQTHLSALDQKGIATMDGINIPPRGSIGTLKSSMFCFIPDDPVLALAPRWCRNLFRLHLNRGPRGTGFATSPLFRVTNILFLSRFGDFWVNQRGFYDVTYISG
jgi:hypothetical protein